MKKIFSTILVTVSILANTSFADEIKEINIQIKNHKFLPEVIHANANEKFKLIVENLDATSEEFESYDLKIEKVIGGNKKGTLIIKPLKAGEYNFVGEFHKDSAKGKIVVK